MKVRLACASLAIALAGASCTTDPVTGESQVSDATIGAVAGAAAGTVLGNQVKGDKNTRQNARIAGAAIGAAAGGGIGYYMDNQEKKLRAELASAGVGIKREGDQIRLIMPGNITFQSGQAAINPNFTPTLDALVKVFKEFNKNQIMIAGHTDNKGNSQANQVLSEQRAKAVETYLQSHGIPNAQINATGFGQSQPVADNATEEGRSQNRRVEITIAQKK